MHLAPEAAAACKHTAEMTLPPLHPEGVGHTAHQAEGCFAGRLNERITNERAKHPRLQLLGNDQL